MMDRIASTTFNVVTLPVRLAARVVGQFLGRSEDGGVGEKATQATGKTATKTTRTAGV
jgi:hypothetical protein